MELLVFFNINLFYNYFIFFAHNYYHNLIIHIIGVFLFCISYLENKKKSSINI